MKKKECGDSHVSLKRSATILLDGNFTSTKLCLDKKFQVNFVNVK